MNLLVFVMGETAMKMLFILHFYQEKISLKIIWSADLVIVQNGSAQQKLSKYDLKHSFEVIIISIFSLYLNNNHLNFLQDIYALLITVHATCIKFILVMCTVNSISFLYF